MIYFNLKKIIQGRHHFYTTSIYFNLKTNTWSPPFLKVEDDGTAIAEAVRNVMNLTFDPISKQPFFVGMINMCHQVGSKGLRDAEVEITKCSNNG